MEQKLVLDPQKFAQIVVQSQPVSGSSEEEIVKNKLKLYLTAYVIVEKFNKLENRAFYNSEVKKHNVPKLFKNIRDISVY
ncbi:hypothetical protein NIE88_02765 [Sporolactobacillus shoreicorticis]|uniref:Uncharacterized protein n=1 Tax=Sporolactobacillus shoreicorticis TaxID=1923877 RepID=A0ABW5S014_9BACL|nr:hypothetical protein [Sporolactobacillus shoreicorticis]MCO7124698.1 hypothetical protein [Sporolactobacillus shoreicorticis]